MSYAPQTVDAIRHTLSRAENYVRPPGPFRSVPIEFRFWKNVSVTPDCWEWFGTKRKGFGRILGVLGKLNGTHRVSYELHVGPIPDGFHVSQICRNRACVNPAHLEALPKEVTRERGLAAQAADPRPRKPKNECKRGHPFTPENRYTRARGNRECRKCEAQRAQRRYAAKQKACNTLPDIVI